MNKGFDNLDDAMLSALLDWRQRSGRSWKEKLQIAWMTGADERDPRGSSLRRIRNRLGPSWLEKLRPCDLDATAKLRGVTAVRPVEEEKNFSL